MEKYRVYAKFINVGVLTIKAYVMKTSVIAMYNHGSSGYKHKNYYKEKKSYRCFIFVLNYYIFY